MSQSVCSFGWQFISWDLTIDVWLCKQPEGCDDDDNDDDEVLIARLPAGIIDKPKSTQEKNPDKEHKKKRDLCCKRAKVCTITRQHGAKFKTPVILVRIKCKSRVLKYAWLKGFELIKRFTLKCNKNFFSPPMCFKALALKKKKRKNWISFKACNWTTRCQSKHVCAWRGGGIHVYYSSVWPPVRLSPVIRCIFAHLSSLLPLSRSCLSLNPAEWPKVKNIGAKKADNYSRHN